MATNDHSNDNGDVSQPTPSSPPTVALIGLGPSGMFFLHALATRVRDLVESCADAAELESSLDLLPIVTCYEMSDGPGGIWRPLSTVAARMPNRKHHTSMYDELWTNLPKELSEFADYTYEDHFGGKRTPAFLPRGHILDYLLSRTTCVDTDLYKTKVRTENGSSSPRRRHTIHYNTIVKNVAYDDATKTFEVTYPKTSDDGSPAVMEQFDYCIWAAGRIGKPRIPRPLLDLLRSGSEPLNEGDSPSKAQPTVPFKGTILHSSHMGEFVKAARNKRLVLIGDSSSAEDLALKAVHDGAKMVYILSRSGCGDAVEMGSWPGTVNSKTGKFLPKVKIYMALPYQVVHNGTGLKCCEMDWNDEDGVYEIDSEEESFTLEDIDTIIFCTGYAPNLDCLDPSQRFSQHEDYFWSAPSNYRMPRNAFSDDIGQHIVPSKELDPSGRVVPGLCRNVLISNPRMMFMTDAPSELPLLELDVAAYSCLSHIVGDTPVLTRKEMENEMEQIMLEEMDHPYLRWEMDVTYFNSLNKLPESHWSNDWEDVRSKEILKKQSEYYVKVLARNMKQANYPVDYGTFDELNDKGKQHLDHYLSSCYTRVALDKKSPDRVWKTYRDAADSYSFKSLFTGQEACPLPGRWLDIANSGESLSFGNTIGSAAAGQIESLVGSLSLDSTQGEPNAPTVVVIGCGPSGMFFLHALASRRKHLQDANDVAGLSSLPIVTCYEAAEKPGGIWRPQGDSKDQDHYPHIHDNCWSNKPKEMVEFADYTFEEHFGGSKTPIYLPKADFAEYLIQRSKCVNPNLFDEVNFGREVNQVTYKRETRKFEVQIASVTDPNRRVTKVQYDYCIWASGQHAKPRIPRQLIRLLRTGVSQTDVEASVEEPFKGNILHSSHRSEKFDAAVRGKRVILIGDSHSAEDSALYAFKLGAESIDILSRSGYGICKETGSWPGNIKVHVAVPCRVINQGTGLECTSVRWEQERGTWQQDDNYPAVEFEKVDTVIFCTGYVPNQDCLSPDLQLRDRDHEENFWVAPSDFKMRSNPLSSELGDVQPSEELAFSNNVLPGVYRNVSIENNRMMYLAALDSGHNLLQLDVAAWLCLAYITGDAVVPSKEEMEKDLQKQMVEEMHIPYLRWEMDTNYFAKIDDLGDDHWTENVRDSRAKQINKEHARYLVKILARDMCDAKYLTDFGTYQSLNENGEIFADMELENEYARSMLDPGAPDAEWKTYRDVDANLFRSIHTGQSASPLPCKWIDLDQDGAVNTSFKRKGSSIMTGRF